MFASRMMVKAKEEKKRIEGTMSAWSRKGVCVWKKKM
jgi:hypothetical protein